jgi:hypothetical protein
MTSDDELGIRQFRIFGIESSNHMLKIYKTNSFVLQNGYYFLSSSCQIFAQLTDFCSDLGVSR